MGVIDESQKKKAAKETKRRFTGEEKRDKRPVTLYLAKANFEQLQEIYGRKTSQVIDELIAELLQSHEK